MRTIVSAVAVAVGLAGVAAAQSAAPKTAKGLEITASTVEHAKQVSLKDCPPGANTVGSTAKPGEEFAVVTLNFKVLPAFKPTTFRRPVLTDASGKTYNTAVTLVDVGKVPEFSCSIPFRVPAGTKAKSIQVEEASLDLTALDK
jgi:uncharacterized protein (DUF2147 family)